MSVIDSTECQCVMLMLINNFLTQLRKPSTQDISVSNTQGKRQKSTLLSVYLDWYHEVLSTVQNSHIQFYSNIKKRKIVRQKSLALKMTERINQNSCRLIFIQSFCHIYSQFHHVHRTNLGSKAGGVIARICTLLQVSVSMRPPGPCSF